MEPTQTLEVNANQALIVNSALSTELRRIVEETTTVRLQSMTNKDESRNDYFTWRIQMLDKQRDEISQMIFKLTDVVNELLSEKHNG